MQLNPPGYSSLQVASAADHTQVEGDRGKGWRKQPAFKASLAKLVKRFCRELRPQLESWSPPKVDLSEAEPVPDQGHRDPSSAFDADEAMKKAEEAVRCFRLEKAAFSKELSPDNSSSRGEGSGEGEPLLESKATAVSLLD